VGAVSDRLPDHGLRAVAGWRWLARPTNVERVAVVEGMRQVRNVHFGPRLVSMLSLSLRGKSRWATASEAEKLRRSEHEGDTKLSGILNFCLVELQRGPGWR
jgi:hypothetical protein